ncbi:MAG: hypothetical protein JO306_16775, partial [Gemmatimonadetes bacterium]|nr:hypothetical protein [Gemmatimonadota bacterium]
PPAVRAAADRAVDEAFVHAFRTVILVAAAMAAASGLVGWRMIEPLRPKQPSEDG